MSPDHKTRMGSSTQYETTPVTAVDSLGRRLVRKAQYPRRYSTAPGDWRGQAACRGHNPELWFPVWQRGQLEQAKAICATCPVIAECLAHAIDNSEAGVWGGATEAEREELRRRMGR